MNSLPRWFGRKKCVETKLKPHIEISEPFSPVHCDGLSSISQSMTSLASENENLYVNGAVPVGQFKEYFMPPSDLPDHNFLVPAVPASVESSLAGSVRSLLPQVSRKIVARAESIRSALSVARSVSRSPRSPRVCERIVRQSTGRRSLMRSASVDVLDDTSRTLRAEEEEEEEESPHNYYNLTELGRSRPRASSQRVLNRENLQHHDLLFTSQPSSDPLATSYLGHTLLTALGQDLESEDSGALSLSVGGLGGGASHQHIVCLPPCTIRLHTALHPILLVWHLNYNFSLGKVLGSFYVLS